MATLPEAERLPMKEYSSPSAAASTSTRAALTTARCWSAARPSRSAPTRAVTSARMTLAIAEPAKLAWLPAAAPTAMPSIAALLAARTSTSPPAVTSASPITAV